MRPERCARRLRVRTTRSWSVAGPERGLAFLLRVGSLAAAVVLVLLLAAQPVAAEEQLSPEALEIANEMNCPVCQGQSVRDSNSQLARQMREVIQQKLEAGESPEQIKAYFVERYGVEILREPPREGFIWVLWWGPVVGLAFGVVVLLAYLRHRSSGAAGEPLDPDELRRVEERLLSHAD